MSAFADLVRFLPVSSGTGDWVVSSAVGGCQTPALANVQNGVSYKVYAVSTDLTQWEVSQGVYNSGTTTFPRTTVLYNSAGTGTATGQSGAGTKISFSTIPQVSIVAIAEDLISPDVANSFTATQQAQIQSNIGFSTQVGMIEFWPMTGVPAGRLKANGQSVSRATYPILLAYLVRSGTATFTNGSTTVGMALHALSVGDPIKLFTTGSLPTNFTAGTHGLQTVGTNYFVASVIDANNVTLAATVGGSAISAGSAGSGTQTWVNAPAGDGDGSTTFTVPDLRGYFVRAWNDNGVVDSNRGMGTVQLDQMQGHFHSATGNTAANGNVGAGSEWNDGTGSLLSAVTATITPTIGSPTSDGTNGTPRTGLETRPSNVAMLATIRYSA